MQGSQRFTILLADRSLCVSFASAQDIVTAVEARTQCVEVEAFLPSATETQTVVIQTNTIVRIIEHDGAANPGIVDWIQGVSNVVDIRRYREPSAVAG